MRPSLLSWMRASDLCSAVRAASSSSEGLSLPQPEKAVAMANATRERRIADCGLRKCSNIPFMRELLWNLVDTALEQMARERERAQPDKASQRVGNSVEKV